MRVAYNPEPWLIASVRALSLVAELYSRWAEWLDIMHTCTQYLCRYRCADDD